MTTPFLFETPNGFKTSPSYYLPADWSEKLDHLFSMLKGLAFTPVIELGSYLWTLSKQQLTLSSILLSGIYGITWLISLCSFFASFDPAYSWKKRLLILTLGFGMLFFGVPLICGFLIGVNGIVKLTVIGIALSLMVTCWVLVPYLAETIEDVVKSIIENFRPSPQSETSEPPSSNLNADIKTSATSTKEVVAEIATRQKKKQS